MRTKKMHEKAGCQVFLTAGRAGQPFSPSSSVSLRPEVEDTEGARKNNNKTNNNQQPSPISTPVWDFKVEEALSSPQPYVIPRRALGGK